MLIAHLVPGYFAAAIAHERLEPVWSKRGRVVLWGAALASTAAPDADVVCNTLFRGFVNHSTLWTHSIFVYLAIGACWWLVRSSGRWLHCQTLAGLVALGGLSHLALDVISHGTPLLYPFTLHMFGMPSQRVLYGGAAAYVTDPIFLLEPLQITVAVAHWFWHWHLSPKVTRLALLGLGLGYLSFGTAYLLLLSTLRRALGLPG